MSDATSRVVRVVVAVVAAMSLAGSATAADLLVGSWRTVIEERTLELVFAADGSGSLGGSPFAWVAEGGHVTVAEANGAISVFAARVEGNTLTLASQQGVLVFERVAPNGPTAGPLGRTAGQGPLGAAVAGGDPVVGNWQGMVNGNPVTMELRADATMTFAGIDGGYTHQAGRLAVTIGGERGVYGARLDGDVLYLSGVDLGGTVEFRRVPPPAPYPAPSGTGGGKALACALYAFPQSPDIVVGFPEGWTPGELGEEGMLAVEFTESGLDRSPGLIAVVVPISAATAIESSEELAALVLHLLQAEALPDLEVLAQRPHPQAPDVTLTDVAASDGGAEYRGQLCSALIPAGPETNVGVFGLFYAPRDRFSASAAERMLTASLAPVFGSIAKLAAASARAGNWTPPSYDGYAYGMGGYSDDMMSAAGQQLELQTMQMQHDAVMSGIASLGESTYEAGWSGDTYVDGNGFEYDYGSSYDAGGY